jgi:site-specific DNA recombinase
MAKRGPRASSTSAAADLAGRQVRCAIYTRKSTEEGLDQAFNSLDAQREACSAYVVSQRHEGWTLLPELYDDGGFSGGTMERPALKRLLADVEGGRVDVIVVYKVDRLTRALSDFAKIVEILDARGASFVSVTQAFNTTTSMGRLTLNVLLSFAQFEREVTGERIRDKIAASKKKGMWMGGPIPLGYDVKERKLVINEAEAETVRFIFARHRQLKTLRRLAADLAARGVFSKLRTMRDGRVTGGTPYSAGALGYLLRNRLYIGQIRHGDHIYAGEHAAILDQADWDASQALLERNARRPRTGQINLLAGLVRDGHGRRMMSAHAIRGNKRYRYYVSETRADIAAQPWRLPAGDVETIVTHELRMFLGDPLRMAAELGGACALVPDFASRCQELAARIREPTACRQLFRDLKSAVNIAQDRIEISLSTATLGRMITGCATAIPPEQTICLAMPVSLRRRGHELRLVHGASHSKAKECDDGLIRLLAASRRAWEELQHKAALLDATRRSHLTRLARLHFLAPDIITAILDGRQPVELTSRTLLRIADLPLDWSGQRQALGFV